MERIALPTSGRENREMTEELFWAIAEPLMERGDVEAGTMMGHGCLRRDGEFAAMVDKSGALIVKLTADLLDELVGERIGEPFAPAGRTFREWILIASPDRARWESLVEEAVALAGAAGTRRRPVGGRDL